MRRSGHATQPGMGSFVIPILLFGFILPFYFDLAGLRLSGYRIVLLIFFFPAVIKWLDGSDRIRTVDLLVVAFALWSALAILVNHGPALWEFIGIRFIETLAPYFIARWVIRDEHAFRLFAYWLLFVILLMLPFSLHQVLTNKSILLDFFSNFGDVYRTVQHAPRLGLYRAQGSLPHPILYGVFCSAAFSLAWYVLGYGKSTFYKGSRAGLVGVSVFTSLSSGAFLAIIVQMALMGWKVALANVKKKWNLLIYIIAGMHVFVELFSNRSLVQIVIANLVLNKSTAWNRIHIFTHASDDILRNPLFGIGIGNWTRPNWLLASVDNFWLVLAMRAGLPAFLLLLAAVILLIYSIGKAPLTGRLASYRLGYVFAVLGVCVAAVTVHLWDATFCLLMFLLGAGAWLIDAKDEDIKDETPPERNRQIRYTRFE